MAILSPTQIYAYAVQAGFSQVDAVKATAIALAESGGRTDVVNGIGAMGLWQIYDGRYPSAQRIAEMSDPLANAQTAFAKFSAAQKTSCGGWWPWASYDEGSCAGSESGRNNSWRQFLGQAQAAATGVDISSGSSDLVIPSLGGGGASTIATGGGGGGGARSLDLGGLGPWRLSLPVGLLWSTLFLGLALAAIGFGVYLIFHQQIDTAIIDVGTAAAAAA